MTLMRRLTLRMTIALVLGMAAWSASALYQPRHAIVVSLGQSESVGDLPRSAPLSPMIRLGPSARCPGLSYWGA
jgi:hypothetical protein